LAGEFESKDSLADAAHTTHAGDGDAALLDGGKEFGEFGLAAGKVGGRGRKLVEAREWMRCREELVGDFGDAIGGDCGFDGWLAGSQPSPDKKRDTGPGQNGEEEAPKETLPHNQGGDLDDDSDDEASCDRRKEVLGGLGDWACSLCRRGRDGIDDFVALYHVTVDMRFNVHLELPGDVVGGLGTVDVLDLVLGFDVEELVDGVGLGIVVDDLVMGRAHQDQVIEGVAFFFVLVGIVAGALGAAGFDVADLTEDGAAIRVYER
jgi:hypothetical protein